MSVRSRVASRARRALAVRGVEAGRENTAVKAERAGRDTKGVQ